MSDLLTTSPRELLTDDLIADPAAQRWEWFTTSGAFHVPDGVTEVWVYALGGGSSAAPLARTVQLQGAAVITVDVADTGVLIVQWAEP